MSQGTAIGRQASSYVTTGRLVPDAVLDQVVLAALAGDSESFVLDGYPRSVHQARRLDAELAKVATDVDAVLNLNVECASVQSRLLARGGGDDSLTMIRERLQDYEASRDPILSHYRSRVVEIDANGLPESVTERILDGIREAIPRG